MRSPNGQPVQKSCRHLKTDGVSALFSGLGGFIHGEFQAHSECRGLPIQRFDSWVQVPAVFQSAHYYLAGVPDNDHAGRDDRHTCRTGTRATETEVSRSGVFIFGSRLPQSKLEAWRGSITDTGQRGRLGLGKFVGGQQSLKQPGSRPSRQEVVDGDLADDHAVDHDRDV